MTANKPHQKKFTEIWDYFEKHGGYDFAMRELERARYMIAPLARNLGCSGQLVYRVYDKYGIDYKKLRKVHLKSSPKKTWQGKANYQTNSFPDTAKRILVPIAITEQRFRNAREKCNNRFNFTTDPAAFVKEVPGH